MTKTTEIVDGIFRISTCVPGVTPGGFTFNQFLIKAEEPLLFHTGPRSMFPLVAEAVSKVVAIEKLQWITFGHVEADECGSMNQWLDAAPKSQVAHGAIGVMVSLNDLAIRLGRFKTAKSWTWEGNGYVTSILRMCLTGGKHASCLRRPPAPCCAGTSSLTLEMDRLSPQRTSWSPPEKPRSSFTRPASRQPREQPYESWPLYLRRPLR